MKIAVIIPARMASKRLPGKAMINICGTPMLERVRRQALKSKFVSHVYIATCDDCIEQYFREYQDTTVIKTSNDHGSGTSRCGEAINKISKNYSHVVLIQGDEPLINPKHIDEFINAMRRDKTCTAWNAVSDCNKKDITDKSVVKAAISNQNHIMFCFRASPFLDIQDIPHKLVKKMQGLMGFKKSYLVKLCELKMGLFESAESIEQMRILENGDILQAVQLQKSMPSVNTKSDLLRVIKIINEKLEKHV